MSVVDTESVCGSPATDARKKAAGFAIEAVSSLYGGIDDGLYVSVVSTEESRDDLLGKRHSWCPLHEEAGATKEGSNEVTT